MSESQHYVSVIWEDETSVDRWWGGLFSRSTHDIIFSAGDINASKKKKRKKKKRKKRKENDREKPQKRRLQLPDIQRSELVSITNLWYTGLET